MNLCRNENCLSTIMNKRKAEENLNRMKFQKEIKDRAIEMEIQNRAIDIILTSLVNEEDTFFKCKEDAERFYRPLKTCKENQDLMQQNDDLSDEVTQVALSPAKKYRVPKKACYRAMPANTVNTPVPVVPPSKIGTPTVPSNPKTVNALLPGISQKNINSLAPVRPPKKIKNPLPPPVKTAPQVMPTFDPHFKIPKKKQSNQTTSSNFQYCSSNEPNSRMTHFSANNVNISGPVTNPDRESNVSSSTDTSHERFPLKLRISRCRGQQKESSNHNNAEADHEWKSYLMYTSN